MRCGAVVLSGIALLFAGCGRRSTEPVNPATLAEIRTEAPPPRPPEPGAVATVRDGLPERVAFEIEGERYTEDFVHLQRRAYLAQCSEEGVAPADDATHRQRLIDELLLLDAASKDPSTADPVLTAQIETMRRRLVTQRFLDRVLFAGLTVSEAEVEAHHRANIARHTQPEQIRIREMTFDTREDAEAALRRLTQGGEDFNLVAQSLSVTPVDPGWFTHGEVPLVIEQAAFPLPIGGISTVVSTEEGYVVLTKVGAIPARVRPLSEVAGEIREELLARRRERLLREFLAAQRLAHGFQGPPVLEP